MIEGNTSGASEFDSDWYYVDGECHRLEGIIRTRTEFSSCRVKRLSQVEAAGGNLPPSEDPFAVISDEATFMTWVFPWELEALTNPDFLLAYITVETERTKIADRFDLSMVFAGVLAIFMGLVLVIMTIFTGGRTLAPLEFGYFLAVIAITVGCVVVLYRKVKQKRHLLDDLDIRYARETDAFRDALRILASLSDHYETYDTTKYAKRYKIIEDALLSGS